MHSRSTWVLGCQHTEQINTGTWLSTQTSGQHGAHDCQHTQQINRGDVIMAVNTRSRSTQETWLSPQTADEQGLFRDVINIDGVRLSHPRDVIDTDGFTVQCIS